MQKVSSLYAIARLPICLPPPGKKLIGLSFNTIKNKRIRDAIANALAGNQSNFEGEYLTVPDNALSKIKANFSPSFHNDGSIAGVLGLFEDISKRQETEDEIRRRKAEFEAIFNSISDAVVFVNLQRQIIMINKAFTDIFGYQLEEVKGKTTQFFYAEPDDYLDQGEKRYHSSSQVDPSVYEINYRRKDGNVFPSETLGAQVKDENGNLIGFLGIMRDISERKKAEQALMESEGKFELLMDSLDAVVYVADMNTYEVLFINKYGKELLGDVTGKICWQSIQADQGGPCSFCTNKYIIDADGNPGPVYIWNFQNTITGQWFHVIDRAIKWIDGRIVRLEIATDISERIKTEEKLKESEEKYSKLFNSEIDAIAIFDATSREIIDCNEAFLKLYGYSHEEALQIKADDISAEPDKTVASIKDSVEKGDTRVHRRLHKKKDGTEIIVDIAAGPFMLKNRKLMFARLRDITDHVKSEMALRDSEERFRIAFHTSPDSINFNKMDGTFVDINEGFTELTGYSREDVIGRSSIEINIWDNIEDRNTMLKVLQECGQVENLEANFRMKDGSIKTALMSASIIQLNGEPHILSITRDITNRKNAEREKAKLEAQLRQVYKMEAIGTMAGGIAHDFNNILTIIVGNADLAKFVTKEDSPGSKNIDRILEASGRAKEMVGQILAFSRQAKQDLLAVKPHLVFTETLRLLRSTIPSTVQIQQKIDPQCRTISADPTQLNQILMNLCANAVHSMDEKGVLKISLHEVELGEEETSLKGNMQPGTYTMLSVSDTGKGMSQEVKERIFDPFFTTKEVGEGTGMGLSVVHGIIEGHGGLITVDSTPGEGSTFKVYFPVVDDSVMPKRDIVPLRNKGDEHILFVDDEKSLVELAVEMLQLHGYTVTSKTNSVKALETFAADPDNFDLVITDQTMPNMTGDELSSELFKIKPGVPIILYTGYSSKISAEMAKELGIAEYFLKPFDMEHLVRSVRKVLDSKKQQPGG
jgi:PAS domain S-box-containing protein